jgi:hypothetical protein
MSTSSTTTTPEASVGPPIFKSAMTPMPVPLVKCEPWCEDGDGHPTAHPEDRRCFVSVADVAMTLPVPYKEGDAWMLASIDVHLRRDPGEGFTRVLLNHIAGGTRGAEVDEWLEFTVDEAERLMTALSSALKVAREGAIPESEAFSAALLEAVGRHLERPVTMPDLEALCNVVGVKPSEIARRSEEIQRGA